MNERAIFNSAVSAIALNALYKTSQDSGRAAPHERLVGLEHHQPERQLVCGARLIPYQGHWLLRNLCTLPHCRGQRLASQLLQQLQQLHDCQPLYTLPLPELDAFYLSNGFQPLGDNDLPAALLPVLRQSRRRHKGIQAMVSCQRLR